jgi:hypothetical protein
MRWLQWGLGVLLILVGVLWLLQGLNVIKGSGMSGQGGWVVGGLIALLFGFWALWSAAKPYLSHG